MEEEKKVLDGSKEIIEYLKITHNFSLSSIRFNSIVKTYGFPIIKIGAKNTSRSDLVDRWMDDLFEKRLIGPMWARYDTVLNPVKKKKKPRKNPYRKAMKRGRKVVWKKDIKESSLVSLTEEIDGFTKYGRGMTRRSLISAGKKLMQYQCSPKFAARIIEQVAWAIYWECLYAYEKEGTPYLKLREQKLWGTWWTYGKKHWKKQIGWIPKKDWIKNKIAESAGLERNKDSDEP